jgi:hypothetical protein
MGITVGDGKCAAEVLSLGLNTSIELDDWGPFADRAGTGVSEGASLEPACSSVWCCNIRGRDRKIIGLKGGCWYPLQCPNEGVQVFIVDPNFTLG